MAGMRQSTRHEDAVHDTESAQTRPTDMTLEAAKVAVQHAQDAYDHGTQERGSIRARQGIDR